MVKAAAFASVYYMVGTKRERQSRFFAGNPCIETSSYALNLAESTHFKSIYDYLLPSLEMVKIVRVPKLDQLFTLENLKTLPRLDHWRDIDHSHQMDKVLELSCESEANDNFDRDAYTQIRILSDKIDPNSGVEKDTLIIHIHGGGFISMSSASHQSYTRGWAKSMPRAVLCSLDYRLAPDSRFPAQLEDTWHAYYWLITNCKEYFGFEAKKVILTGDSAGGNLVLAITVMAIQRGFRVPSGIIPQYPCTVTTVCEFWPSLLFSLDDPLLSQNFLANCVIGYN